MNNKIKNQILKIRSAGQVNMLDVQGVQFEAYINNYFELVNYIQEQKENYIKFILKGYL